MGKYTPEGSSKLDALIDSHMKRVVEEVLKRIPARKIKSIILGGGYGRGEGGIIYRDGNEALFNDFDLFVITPNLKRLTLNKMNHELLIVHKELTQEFGIDVDFGPCKSMKFIESAPFWLMFYELKYGHKVIYGDKGVLNYLPSWDGADISLFEGLKLLLNRGVALLQSQLRLLDKLDEEGVEYITRNNQKAIMALGDVLLMSKGLYHYSYIKRSELIEQLYNKDIDNLIENTDLVNHYKNAINFKLFPAFTKQDPEELWSWTNGIIAIFEDIYLHIFQEYSETSGKFTKSEYEVFIEKEFNFEKEPLAVIKNILLNVEKRSCSLTDFKDIIRHPSLQLYKGLPKLLFEHKMSNIQEFKNRDCLTWENKVDIFLNVWSMYN